MQTVTDKKQPENLEYFNYLGSMITNDAKCTREIKYRITTAKSAFQKKTLHQQIGLKFNEESSKVLPWSITLRGAENSTIGKKDQKYLECFKM